MLMLNSIVLLVIVGRDGDINFYGDGSNKYYIIIGGMV
jgi:hypothetical protein